MKDFSVEATKHLPDHDAVLNAILNFFYQTPGVTGCFLSGSTATGQMDVDSDLDLGVVFQDTAQRVEVWEKRWDWQIAPWFHRFDADHIKSHFVIYFFEPTVKADMNLYVNDDLPSAAGGPYHVVWDKTGSLTDWANALVAGATKTAGATAAKQAVSSPDWREVVHEDERFWAWLFYLYNHVHRGEYYHCAYEFPVLRDIIEKWAARLAGQARFESRRLESATWAGRLLACDLFPRPDRVSLKACMVNAIEIQLELRSEIENKMGVSWKTNERAIVKISRMIDDL